MMFFTSIFSYLLFSHAVIVVGGAVAKSPSRNSGGSDAVEGVTFAPISTIKNWGGDSPMYPVKEYQDPPKGCDITQVNILKRHGARYPTAGDTPALLSAVNKITSATSFTKQNLQFIKDYKYDLGTDSLIPLGAKQSHIAGEITYNRYRNLINPDNIPFVRSTGSQRVIDSANNWTVGFSVASHHRFNPVLSVIMSESSSSNNTLDGGSCPRKVSSNATSVWASIYATPIANRLNSQALGMSANLTATDIDNLIGLCPFDSDFKQKLSPWCNVFEPQDFVNFEWSQDLSYYYGTGYGQPIGGRSQGVGYTNELIARLTNSPVKDDTKTNKTLDSNPATFPLGRTIYADFSHDDQLIAIISAIGLLNQTHEVLSDTKRNPNTIWDVSEIVPFAGQVVFERLSCIQQGHKASKPEEYIRVLINDALQPLEFCGADKDGLCTLSNFLESQSYSINNGEGDFQKCFSP